MSTRDSMTVVSGAQVLPRNARPLSRWQSESSYAMLVAILTLATTLIACYDLYLLSLGAK
jgi:hypothetical protein